VNINPIQVAPETLHTPLVDGLKRSVVLAFWRLLPLFCNIAKKSKNRQSHFSIFLVLVTVGPL
jgi:hypothetical protein